MNLTENPTELLKEYFFKALLIQQSTKMIDEKNELELIDQKKIDKRNTILTIHNLRLFRNCVTHANPSEKEVEKEFDEYNLNLKKGEKSYSKIQDLGQLQRELFYYSFDPNKKNIFLSLKSFNELLDFYSQLAYIAYLCYCDKFKLKVEIE